MNFPYDSYFSIHFSVGSCSLEEEKATCYRAAAALAYLTTPILSSPCYSLWFFFQSFSGELKKNNMTERKMSTNWQKLQGALYCFLSLTSCFIGFFYMYCPILPLLLFNRKLFRKITGYFLSNQHIINLFMSFCTIFSYVILGWYQNDFGPIRRLFT